VVTWPYLVFVFVTVVYLVSVVGLVTVETPEVTPVLVEVKGTERVLVDLMKRTSSTRMVVGFSDSARQYGNCVFK
jgi:hypothetical protein